MSGNNQRNNQQRSYREMSQEASASKGSTLSPGIRNFLIFVLSWSAFSHLLMISGLWNYEGQSSAADVVLSTINIVLPIVGSIFIFLLYDKDENG